MKKGAIISECGKYRYQLWRIWDESLPKVLFIMHNPSKADADNDDPTIRRCIGYAKFWGYGGIYVGNLFPYRATDPNELKKLSVSELWPIENIKHTSQLKAKCKTYILAYGNPFDKSFTPSPDFIDADWKCLKLTKSGNPCHPLYLKSDLVPIPLFITKSVKKP